REGDLVLAEAPPHQLPLRGHEDARLGDGARVAHGRGVGGLADHVRRRRHHVFSSRVRGSIHTRGMSGMSVPITVMTPRSSTIVRARNMSCAMRALSSSGPTVGSPRTSETMMLPDTMYGSV